MHYYFIGSTSDILHIHLHIYQSHLSTVRTGQGRKNLWLHSAYYSLFPGPLVFNPQIYLFSNYNDSQMSE
jgi:hypothetical protein